MSVLLCLVAGAVFTYVVVYYGVFRAARCTWSGTLSGKTVIVTGNTFDIYDPGEKVGSGSISAEAPERSRTFQNFPEF